MRVGEYEIIEVLQYTEKHEWAKMEESGLVRIGVTDYAQKNLHEVVFVELPSVGAFLSQMEVLGTVESIKAVSEVYSPISGEVVETNQILETSPELVNEDPYGSGWIAVIRPTEKTELQKLMGAKEYANMLLRARH